MKTTILCILLIIVQLIIATALFSANVTPTVTTSRVELFRNGAQVFKTVKYQSTDVLSTLVIPNIPADIDQATIRAKAIRNQKIVSVIFETDYSMPASQLKRLETLKDSIETKGLELDLATAELSALKDQETLIRQNQNVYSEKLGTAELEKLLVIYNTQLLELKRSIVNQSNKLAHLSKAMDQLEMKHQMASQSDDRLAGRIVIEVVARENSANTLEVSYMVADAWWKPVYDVRVKDIFSPVEFEYKAEVFQQSGEDWKDVELFLLTNNPEEKGELIELRSWKLNYSTRPPDYSVANKSRSESLPPSALRDGHGALMGTVTDEKKTGVPFANIALKQNDKLILGTTSDFDGNYKMKGLVPGYYDLEVTSLGYSPAQFNEIRILANKVNIIDANLAASAVRLETFQLVQNRVSLIEKDGAATGTTIMASDIQRVGSGGGSGYHRSPRASSQRGSIALMDDFETESELRLVFEAQGKQSLPSSAKVKLVYLQSREAEANFVFRCIPRVSPDFHLFAEIPEWEALGLLSAEVNLFYENTFVGQTSIDAQSTLDTMLLSLGIDQMLISKRETQESELQRSGLSNASIAISGIITVKSQKPYPVIVRIEDQIPVSRNSDLEVALTDSGDAEFDKQKGFLSWEFELEAKETDTRSFTYEVKFPKDTRIVLE